MTPVSAIAPKKDEQSIQPTLESLEQGSTLQVSRLNQKSQSVANEPSETPVAPLKTTHSDVFFEPSF